MRSISHGSKSLAKRRTLEPTHQRRLHHHALKNVRSQRFLALLFRGRRVEGFTMA